MTRPPDQRLCAERPSLGERGVVVAEDLLVRQEPDGEALGTLYEGETFQVARYSTRGRWAYGFAYGEVNKNGWVLAEYLCSPRANIARRRPVWERFAPVVYLARGERFTPVDASRFIARSDLWWSHDGCDQRDGHVADVQAWRLGIAAGENAYQHRQGAPPRMRCREATPTHIGDPYFAWQHTRPGDAEKAAGLRQFEGFYLDLEEDARGGHGVSAPMYYEYNRTENWIAYWFFYAYNNQPSAGPVSPFDHEGDWERIVVRLEADHSDWAWIDFHYHNDSTRCTKAQLRTERPRAFSALGGHGSYWAEGSFPTRFGISRLRRHDQTSSGDRWDARAAGRLRT
ncbi:MAG: hypothetical protein LC808_34680 [Actinobacteria bacterium]|nr:hypothetical protein [Actinomycetota bacterium]